MKNLEQQFEMIQKVESAQKRKEFIKYCQMAVTYVEDGTLTIEKAAYSICGVLGHEHGWMSREDQEITDMACQLELPEAHRDLTVGNWDTLVKKVKDLKQTH